METHQKYIVGMYAIVCIAFIVYLYIQDKRSKEVDRAILRSVNQDLFIKEQYIEQNIKTPPPDTN